MEKWHLVNASEVLAFLCAAGLVTCLWRLPKAEYPGHLVAFGLMLVGTLIREGVVHFWGPAAWTEAAILISAVARDVQIVGALLFVRAVTRPRCGEWVWLGTGLAGLIFAVLVAP